jgi:hypothetical protein
MKKLILFAVFCFLSTQHSNATYTCWITERTNPPTTGPDNYYTVTTSETADHSTLVMSCVDPGSQCCEWTLVPNPTPFTQAYVNQAVAQQIANGNNSGQIYLDGSAGTSTIDNFNFSGPSCFLWKITFTNNIPTIKTLIFSGNNNQ